jgi:hypothetical protein
MKLLRCGQAGSERPGVLDAGGVTCNLSGIISDVPGAALLPASLQELSQLDLVALPLVEGSPRLAPCVGSVGNFIYIALNYSDHAAEAGMAVPAEPVVFMKATSALCVPDDDVVMPRGSRKTDWEVELDVGFAQPPPRYLDAGNGMRLGIDGVGFQQQTVVSSEFDSVRFETSVPGRGDHS